MSLQDDREDTDYFLSRVTGSVVQTKPKKKTSGLDDKNEKPESARGKLGKFLNRNKEDESETDQLLATAPETSRKKRGRKLFAALSLTLVLVFGAGTVLFWIHTKALAKVFPEAFYAGLALGGLGIVTGIIGMITSCTRSVCLRLLYITMAVLTLLAILAGLALGVLGSTDMDKKLGTRWHEQVNSEPENICGFESHYECSGWKQNCANTDEMIMEALCLDTSVTKCNFTRTHLPGGGNSTSANATNGTHHDSHKSGGGGSKSAGSKSGGSKSGGSKSGGSKSNKNGGGSSNWMDANRLAASAQSSSRSTGGNNNGGGNSGGGNSNNGGVPPTPSPHGGGSSNNGGGGNSGATSGSNNNHGGSGASVPPTPAPIHNSTTAAPTSAPALPKKNVRCALCLVKPLPQDANPTAVLNLKDSSFKNLYSTSCQSAFEHKVKHRLYFILGALGVLLLAILITCMLAWYSRAQIVEASIPTF